MSGTPFTRAWEDDRVDLAALAVQPSERVLAIAAAGDIPLALASEGAAELIAVDLNPARSSTSARCGSRPPAGTPRSAIAGSNSVGSSG